MAGLREFADRLWQGEIDTVVDSHPVTVPWNDRQAEEIAEGVLYYKGLAAATTLDAGDTLVMLDTGAQNDAERLHSAVRDWRREPRLAAAVFSHHHVDHVFGVAPFDREAADRGTAPPLVYGHERIPEHFRRYQRTRGWNAAINRRQFARPDMPLSPRFEWPGEFRFPDVTYRDRLRVHAGDLTLELEHARGETEDATWTWVSERQLLAPGDLFIWATPNAGNPQKAQRWVGEWAAALRQMSALGAELLVPGHGLPIFGADRIRQALDDTAELLESIERQVLALMNAGASLDRVLHEVEIPRDALAKPYLRPVYDHPQFLVRNVWRYYGGWWDGEPDRLLPAPRADEAREWVALAGGLAPVLARAEVLRDEGNLRLASHLVEVAVRAEPGSREAHELRAEIYDARATLEPSSMARGIFMYAASSSREGKRDGFDPE